MIVKGDVESVNLSTGEKFRRIVGNGESRLEPEFRNYYISKARAEREAEIRHLEHRLDILKRFDELHPCEFCRDLPRGNKNLKEMQAEAFGLVVEGEIASCPKCGDELCEWES